MPQFTYQARDARGQMTSGVVMAPSLAEARKMLRSENKFPVQMAQAAGEESETSRGPERKKRIRRDDVIYFSHQMATMLQTGVPLGEALDSVAEQTSNPTFRAVIQDINDHVQSGTSFSQALSRHPRVFPGLMASLVRASEVTGTMGQMLDRISAYLTKERQTIRKVRGALMYPSFMLLMAIGVTVFLMTFVMPRFASIYDGRGATLPLPTRLLLGASDAMIHYWYVWVGIIFASVGVLMWMRRVPAGRRMLDRFKLDAPIFGKMMRQLYLTRAMQTMGTMVNAGVPMLDMIAIARTVTANVYFEDLWDQINEQVRQGAQLSVPMFDSELIPKSIALMLSSGEKAGRLGAVMERIAEFTETDFDESVKTATQFIEPIMITAMGVIIGSVAIGLLLPIFSIGKVMAG